MIKFLLLQKHGVRLKCSACRIIVHSECLNSLPDSAKCKSSFKDDGVRQYREHKTVKHHWMHRRTQKDKCSQCGKVSSAAKTQQENLLLYYYYTSYYHHHYHRCFRVYVPFINRSPFGLPTGFPIGTVFQFQGDHSAHVLLVQIERPQQDRMFQRHKNERALFLR